MSRISRAFLIPVVGTFAWLLVGAMARPAAAQESDPASATPSFTPIVSPEQNVLPTDPTTWNGKTEVCPHGNVVLQSIFGKPDPNTWRPLPLSTFFSEGWNEAWVPSPDGSGGAPRQGWINAMDGNMYRLWWFTFAEGFNYSASNAYQGAYTLYTPLNRRLELITNIPFVVAGNVSTGLPIINPTGRTATTSQTQTTFGDMTFTPRVLLHETQDFTLTSEMAVVTPTGASPLAGKTSLIPAVGFWNNVAGTWVIRGGVGLIIPLKGGGADTLISQFAVGQTLTAHDVPVIGDFTYYLSAISDSVLSTGGQTSVSLTPGIRTHLGQDWYFLAGLQTPLTKARIADLSMIFWFMKAW
jgi:hypothetical protein